MTTGLTRLTAQYLDAVEHYLKDGGEGSLSLAYELGRRALIDGMGILDLVGLHEHAIETLVLSSPAQERASRARGSSEFFRELLSPFEMTFRGYRQANQELQRLNEDMAGQKQRVETSNRELESFSYSVSHDLRAPLRGIEGFSRALLESCSDKLDERGKNYLQLIREAAERMAQLIDDLLELSRVSRIELTRASIDLTALARRVMATFQATDPERAVHVTIEDGLLEVGDGRLLELVLQNLLGNAWKFTSKLQKATIEFDRFKKDGRWNYFVRDNGAGFDSGYASKLFSLFQRLHAESDFEGTGVGLAIVRRIVNRHGGEVWAEGHVDRGATFYFTLTDRRGPG